MNKERLALGLTLLVIGLILTFGFWTLIGAKTLDEFNDQTTYDLTFGTEGADFEDYNDGDTAYIRDIVQDSEYIEDLDITVLDFPEDTSVTIDGDVESLYPSG